MQSACRTPSPQTRLLALLPRPPLSTAQAYIDAAVASNPGNKSYTPYYYESPDMIGPAPDFGKGFASVRRATRPPPAPPRRPRATPFRPPPSGRVPPSMAARSQPAASCPHPAPHHPPHPSSCPSGLQLLPTSQLR